MFTTLTQYGSEEQYAEQTPVSSPPWIWIGFVFAGAFFITELAVLLMGIDEASTQLLFFAVFLAGWIYWMFCVHRFHRILAEMSVHRYPISPGEAVAKHFIPFYNFFWLYKWPAVFSNYLRHRGDVRILPGALLGFLLLFSVILRFFDGAIALACIFGIGTYMLSKLRSHIGTIKGLTPDMLPPPPNENLFGYTPVKSRDIVDNPGSAKP